MKISVESGLRSGGTHSLALNVERCSSVTAVATFARSAVGVSAVDIHIQSCLPIIYPLISIFY